MRKRKAEIPRPARMRKAARVAAPKGSVRVATTMAVPALLQEYGVDPAALLAEFGLAPAIYDDPENMIPFDASCRILRRCAEAAGCPHFGLLVGQRASISALGALGFLMQSSDTVRAALTAVATHFRVHNSGAAIEFVEADDLASLGISILSPGLDGHEQLLPGMMAMASNVMRMLCGPQWRPYEVRFSRAPPPDAAPFKRFFNSRLVFDASETALVFDRHWLDRPLPSADPLLNVMMRQRVADMESRSTETVSGQLRRVLPAMVTGRDSALEAAAGRLGIGTRTLHRRLAAEGTSFRQLLDDSRHRMAQQLLADTRLEAGEIAERLGYASASAFTRAFRRWSGLAPIAWRRRSRKPARKRQPRR